MCGRQTRAGAGHALVLSKLSVAGEAPQSRPRHVVSPTVRPFDILVGKQILDAAGMQITSSIIFVFVRLDDAFCRLKHDPGTANQHRPRTHAKSARGRVKLTQDRSPSRVKSSRADQENASSVSSSRRRALAYKRASVVLMQEGEGGEGNT
jgi:hypothetical protein